MEYFLFDDCKFSLYVFLGSVYYEYKCNSLVYCKFSFGDVKCW